MPADEQQDSGDDGKQDLDHAIGHPIRREILRALLAAPAPMTVEELGALVPTANLSALGYHVKVLEQRRCVEQAGEVVLSNGAPPLYVATVADSLFVMGMLESTRQADERR